MRIARLGVGDDAQVLAAAHLFDGPPEPAATRRFLADPNHHLLLAYEGDAPAGFVSGVEVTHPDKGTEMFLYELGVDEAFRGRGTAGRLVEALCELARECGCYGMWVGTEDDNDAARAVYRATGGTEHDAGVTFDWCFDTSSDPPGR